MLLHFVHFVYTYSKNSISNHYKRLVLCEQQTTAVYNVLFTMKYVSPMKTVNTAQPSCQTGFQNEKLGPMCISVNVTYPTIFQSKSKRHTSNIDKRHHFVIQLFSNLTK